MTMQSASQTIIKLALAVMLAGSAMACAQKTIGPNAGLSTDGRRGGPGRVVNGA
jgi:hypothetical protein